MQHVRSLKRFAAPSPPPPPPPPATAPTCAAAAVGHAHARHAALQVHPLEHFVHGLGVALTDVQLHLVYLRRRGTARRARANSDRPRRAPGAQVQAGVPAPPAGSTARRCWLPAWRAVFCPDGPPLRSPASWPHPAVAARRPASFACGSETWQCHGAAAHLVGLAVDLVPALKAGGVEVVAHLREGRGAVGRPGMLGQGQVGWGGPGSGAVWSGGAARGRRGGWAELMRPPCTDAGGPPRGAATPC
jgi:hypothetical protein